MSLTAKRDRRSSMLNPSKLRLLRLFGPGRITGASDDDPSGIGTYSQAGAQFGFAISWTMLFSYPLMVAIQQISARIGRITGKGIAGNLRQHYPKRLLQSIVALLFLANTVNIGADFGAMADAVGLLIGGPALVYIIVFGVLCAILQVFISYRRYVAVLRWLTLALFSYFGTVMVVHIPWGEAARGLLMPAFFPDAAFWTTVVAVLGTTISPYLFFWQAAQEAEDIRIDPESRPLLQAPQQGPDALERIRVDTFIGMAFSNLVAVAIIWATAATLHAAGVTDTSRRGPASRGGSVCLHPICPGHHWNWTARSASPGGVGRLCGRRGVEMAGRTQPQAGEGQGVLHDAGNSNDAWCRAQLFADQSGQSALLECRYQRDCGGADHGRDDAYDGQFKDHGFVSHP